jgi:hypothetical protein
LISEGFFEFDFSSSFSLVSVFGFHKPSTTVVLLNMCGDLKSVDSVLLFSNVTVLMSSTTQCMIPLKHFSPPPCCFLLQSKTYLVKVAVSFAVAN